MDEQVIKPSMGFIPSNKPSKKESSEPAKLAPPVIINFFSLNIDPAAVLLLVVVAIIAIAIFRSGPLRLA